MLLYHPLSSASKRPLRRAERLECRRNPARTLRRSASKSAPERPRREPKRRNPTVSPEPRTARSRSASRSRPGSETTPEATPDFCPEPQPAPRTCPGTACTKRATPLPTVVKSHVFSVNTRRAFCRLFPPLRARLTRLCNACRVQRRAPIRPDVSPVRPAARDFPRPSRGALRDSRPHSLRSAPPCSRSGFAPAQPRNFSGHAATPPFSRKSMKT